MIKLIHIMCQLKRAVISLSEKLPLHGGVVSSASGQQTAATGREADVADSQVTAVGVTVELAAETGHWSLSGHCLVTV